MKSSMPQLFLRFFSNFCRRWTRILICTSVLFTVMFFILHYRFPVSPYPKVNTFVRSDDSSPQQPDQPVPKKSFLPTPMVVAMASSSREGRCRDIAPPKTVLTDTFQPMDKSTNAYFFSAYYDNRHGKRQIRVIGARAVNTNLWCQLWYLQDGKTVLDTVSARVFQLPEGAGRRYESIWVICVNPSSRPVPVIVSISPEECGIASNHLKVTQVITEPPVKTTFALCVTPFNLKYDKVDEFIEIMTLNKMFGAEHAYFYNYSTSPRIRKISEIMSREGFATVVQWHLPMKVHVWPVPPGYVEEIKYYGQMAMLQDCLMRGMGKHKFLVFTDLDELAVPRRHRTWHELFDARGFSVNPPAVVTFRNTFFKLEWESDPKSREDKRIVAVNPRVLMKTKREKTVYNPGARSKYIIDPLQIRSCGVHNIWEYENHLGSQTVLSPDEGLLHHYRNWEGLGEKEFVVDRNMLRFRDNVLKLLTDAKYYWTAVK